MIDDGVGKFLRIVTPLQHEEYVIGIWERSRLKIGGWFRGQVFLAIIEGSLTYIGLLIIGVPYALILGILAFFFSLIPYGVMLSGFLAVVVAFLTGGIPMALTTFLFILLLQQVETYVWQPLIIHSVTGVPSLIIIISLVIGAQLAGLMGLLLAVPVAVVILEIVHDTEQKRFALMQQQHTMFDNSSE
ncbi:MAG: AI-2E family transporter [Candidatus Pacebacteria bacterium]|nr:AI-2E family transporter [Candidatus Paceibacterota bacterium]MCD8508009.1 AI-2E family transporter [Candidatus Paceibacterota bacterium]